MDIPHDCKQIDEGTILRILTDVNEFCVQESSRIATLDGLRSAADIRPNDHIDIFNRADGFRMVYESLLHRSPETIVFDGRREISLDPSIAYVLGTQILAKRYEYKVVMNIGNQEHWTELAAIFDSALRKAHMYGNVLYTHMAGPRVVIDSVRFAQFVDQIFSDDMLPQEIRTSSLDILVEFYRGIMDSFLRSAEAGLAKLRVRDTMHELRRFILFLGKMFQLVPFAIRHGSVTSRDSSTRLRETTLYFRVSDLSRLNLRNINLTYSTLPRLPELKKHYARARIIRKFRKREIHLLQCSSIHAAPIVDLVSVYPKRES